MQPVIVASPVALGVTDEVLHDAREFQRMRRHEDVGLDIKLFNLDGGVRVNARRFDVLQHGLGEVDAL